jgi:hypothetical protein
MPKKSEPIPEPQIPECPRIAEPEPEPEPDQPPPPARPCMAGVPVPSFLFEDDGEEQLGGELEPLGSDDDTPTPELNSYGPSPTQTHRDDEGDDEGDDEPTPVPPQSRRDRE